MKLISCTLLLLGLGLGAASWADEPVTLPLAPTELAGLAYDREFFPGTQYDPAVPTPETLLGFPVGQRFASPSAISACLAAWADASPRAQLVQYARSHEDRPLHYMIISSAENLARLDEIKSGLALLSDPRQMTDEDAERLLHSLPGVAWFGYSIHGNETSGADAALAVIYHLVAERSEEVTRLLADLVVLVDPLMNPDGRARFFKQTQEHRGVVPNVDDQSLLHRGYWPSGRVNHYLFDLNRDWIFGAFPETRGRVAAIAEWSPLLVIDGHEMGALNTYLFSPPRDPVNPNYPERRWHWAEIFARDQADAFDSLGWLYYTGEWADDWYAGYSSWAAFRGSVHILYEQAGIAEDAVRRPEGTLMTYGESVHHQVVSTLTNLRTLHEHFAKLQEEFLAERRQAVSDKGPYAQRTFAILPGANTARLQQFVELMQLQGIEVHVAERDFVAKSVTDRLGRKHSRQKIPAGTLLIPNRQPEAHLVAAMLEFDPRMGEETLRREREELLRRGHSRMYDVTAWNLTMMYDLPALTLAMDLPDVAVPHEPAAAVAPSAPAESVVGFCFDGADDRSVAAAARLMERGVQVRAADRASTFDGLEFARGSILVTCIDNAAFTGDLAQVVAQTAGELGLTPTAIGSAMGAGDLPDLGGRHFVRLEPPRIALLGRGGISVYDYGAVWFALDHQLGIRHSHLNEGRLNGADLRRYNVLVLPDRWWGKLADEALQTIGDWVRAGGTLVAIGASARTIASEDAGISQVRRLPDVLDQLDRYELAVFREWLASTGDVPTSNEVWSHTARSALHLPWAEETRRAPDAEKAEPREDPKRRDEWLQLFMPQGAFLAGRVDGKHWLTCGCDEYLPILFGSAVGTTAVLMAAGGVTAPVRLGYITPAENNQAKSARESGRTTFTPGPDKIGWARLPAGHELYLRMSGLLWPEAAHRLANAAAVTRERVGKGQVILFAAPPAFRAAALGTTRLLLNALVYGPGMGASSPVRP